jgi:hypothetical protein
MEDRKSITFDIAVTDAFAKTSVNLEFPDRCQNIPVTVTTSAEARVRRIDLPPTVVARLTTRRWQLIRSGRYADAVNGRRMT